jgi:hypothetical protein
VSEGKQDGGRAVLHLAFSLMAITKELFDLDLYNFVQSYIISISINFT